VPFFWLIHSIRLVGWSLHNGPISGPCHDASVVQNCATSEVWYLYFGNAGIDCSCFGTGRLTGQRFVPYGVTGLP